jgi:effector-binding domain-containing protein
MAECVHLHATAVGLAVVRRRVRQSELARLVPECCGLVWNFARAHGLKGGRHVAVYLNSAIDVEIGVEVAGDFEEGDGVVRSSTPAGPVVTATHFGPYQGLGTTHRAIEAWCRSNGRQPTGVSWEIYGHWEADWNTDSSCIRTDVYYQVRP